MFNFIEHLHIYSCEWLWSYDVVKTILVLGVRVVVFNATFNNISVISWLSGLLEETGVRREKHLPAVSH
jgi:hypothetical protein